MRLKLQNYYETHPERYRVILYLHSIRDDRRERLRSEAQYLSHSFGVAAAQLDGMPKGKGGKRDVVGDMVVQRKKIANEYARNCILYARSHTDFIDRCKRAGISNFVMNMMYERYIKDVPMKNLQMRYMYDRTKIYRIINDGLDKLYPFIDDEWK